MNQTSVVFVLIGMVFGWPYALLHFSPLQWIHTNVYKRLLRMILGVAITVGVQTFFLWVTEGVNDEATRYVFGYALPGFLNSFFIFGFFPIACVHMRLVQKEEQFATQFPDITRATSEFLRS